MFNILLTADGQVGPFYSSNMVQFFESDSFFDDNGANLDAKLSEQDASYIIQLYDPTTTPPTPLTTISGSTSNGIIQEDWGVTNADGTPFIGDAVTAVFNVTQDDPSTNTLIRLGSSERVGLHDGFDFGYLYTPPFEIFSAFLGNYGGMPGIFWQGMQNVVNTLLAPSMADLGTPNYYTSGFNYYTYQPNDPLGYGTSGYPGYINDNAALNRLFYDMTNHTGNVKNLFMAAHGSQYDLADFYDQIDISTWDVSSRLGNIHEDGHWKQLNNPYRFVFLYACSCAGYPDWRRAFGIMPLYTDETAEFQQKLGPQAFVGWGKPVQSPTAPYFNSALAPSTIFETLEDVPGAGLNVQKTEENAWCFTQTLNNFYYEWMWDTPLAQCIHDAAHPGYGQYPFPLPGITKYTLSAVGGPFGAFNFTTKHTFNAPLYVIGHSGLTRSGCKTDLDNLYHPSTSY